MNRTNMSIATAKQLGIALGMWAIDEAEQRRCLETTPGSMDCVTIEESDVYAAVCREIGTEEPCPQYDMLFAAMYESARNEMYRRGHWKGDNPKTPGIAPIKLRAKQYPFTRDDFESEDDWCRAMDANDADDKR